MRQHIIWTCQLQNHPHLSKMRILVKNYDVEHCTVTYLGNRVGGHWHKYHKFLPIISIPINFCNKKSTISFCFSVLLSPFFYPGIGRYPQIEEFDMGVSWSNELIYQRQWPFLSFICIFLSTYRAFTLE